MSTLSARSVPGTFHRYLIYSSQLYELDAVYYFCFLDEEQ